MWHRINTMIKKEIILILRDKIFIYMILIAPFILFIILGYAINNDYKNIPTAIYNYQSSSYINDFLQALTNSKIFKITYFTQNDSDYEQLIKQEKVKMVIGFPDNISNLTRRNKTIGLQTVIDGSNSNLATIAQGYLETIIQDFNQRHKTQKDIRIFHLKQKDFITLNTNILYNKNLITKNFIIPGLITIIILGLFPTLLGFSINGEKDAGTLNQVFLSNIQTHEFFIGKVIPLFIIESFIIYLLLFISYFLFKVPFKGSFAIFSITIIIFSTVSLALGFLISSISHTKNEVMAYITPIVIMPSLLLSGYMFPITSMPKFMQIFSRIVPARYSILIMINIFLKTSNLKYLIDEFLWFTIIGLLIFIFSFWNFNRAIKDIGRG